MRRASAGASTRSRILAVLRWTHYIQPIAAIGRELPRSVFRLSSRQRVEKLDQLAIVAWRLWIVVIAAFDGEERLGLVGGRE
jgi:hypothetical protein